VSLRQSGMAHFDMWKIFDPIMFHNPLNGVFEWSTANDSGRLMAGVCDDSVPDEFWGGFYNIGGGATSRVVNHEFMARSMPNYREVLAPHWFATRNFHGQWYSDSDRLEALVPFREQSLQNYFNEAPRHMPAIARLVPKLMPRMVRRRIERLAEAPGGSLYWFAHDDEAHIRAYFGSRAAWEAIPRDWEGFDYAQPSRQPTFLDHGYDETKASDRWTAADLRGAAEFRGGRLLDDAFDSALAPAKWECASGHRFEMTPNLMLKGGQWCPTCMIDPAGYPATAERNLFFRQVWTEEAAH
jgi:hypothetical protein